MGLLLDTNVLIPVVDDKLDLLPRDIRAEVEHGADDVICKAERLQLVTTDSKLVDHPLAWRPASA